MKCKSILIVATAATLAALPMQGAWAQGFSGHGGARGGWSGAHGGSVGAHRGDGRGGDGRGGDGRGGDWRGGDWRGGGWRGGGWQGGNGRGGGWRGGGWHGGGWQGNYWRPGYWGSSWGFYLGAPWYPAAVWGYPYAGFAGSTIIYDDPAPVTWGPAVATVIPAPSVNSAPASATPAPAAQFRYYCPDRGYYPDVRTCPEGWVQIPPG